MSGTTFLLIVVTAIAARALWCLNDKRIPNKYGPGITVNHGMKFDKPSRKEMADFVRNNLNIK